MMRFRLKPAASSMRILLAGLVLVVILGYFARSDSGEQAFKDSVARALAPTCSDLAALRKGAQPEKIDPVQPIEINLSGAKLKIPWAYFQARPIAADCPAEQKSIGFQFWIPDLRPPERDLFFNGEYRPVETGRPAPGPDEWVIKVTSLERYDAEHPPGNARADDGIRNRLRIYHDNQLQIVSDLGLSKMQTNHADLQSWFSQGNKESFLLWCTSRSEREICQGRLDLKDLGFNVRFLIPMKAIEHHAVATQGIRKLLNEWH